MLSRVGSVARLDRFAPGYEDFRGYVGVVTQTSPQADAPTSFMVEEGGNLINLTIPRNDCLFPLVEGQSLLGEKLLTCWKQYNQVSPVTQEGLEGAIKVDDIDNLLRIERDKIISCSGDIDESLWLMRYVILASADSPTYGGFNNFVKTLIAEHDLPYSVSTCYERTTARNELKRIWDVYCPMIPQGTRFSLQVLRKLASLTEECEPHKTEILENAYTLSKNGKITYENLQDAIALVMGSEPEQQVQMNIPVTTKQVKPKLKAVANTSTAIEETPQHETYTQEDVDRMIAEAINGKIAEIEDSVVRNSQEIIMTQVRTQTRAVVSRYESENASLLAKVQELENEKEILKSKLQQYENMMAA